MRKRTLRILYFSISATSVVGVSRYWYKKRKLSVSEIPGKFDLSVVKGYNDIKRLNEFDLANELKCLYAINSLEGAGWCLLAFENHPVFRYFKPKMAWSLSASDEDVSLLLAKLNLDTQWLSALNWYLTNICTEEDLYCQETSPLSRESSKNERLVKLLRILLFKSECEDCDTLVNQNILYILYRVLDAYYESSRLPISIVILKILSNIARKSRSGAQQICESPLLEKLHAMVHRSQYEEETILAHKVFINMLHVLGVRGAYSLPPSVYEFHRPPFEVAPVLDVVFVHGLRGNAFRTWRQRDNPKAATIMFWPKKWLSADVSHPIRILALDYSSRLLSFGSVMETVSARSEKFQQELEAAEVGSRPLIFICHSMGGLLVKHMLISNENLLRRTVGVLFMSTPHQGSPLAGYGIVRPSDDLRLLRVDNETNQQLNADFKRLAVERIPLFVSILELRETPIFGIKHFIVPYESAILGRGAVYHVDAHHHHVCKPKSREDISYAIVLNFVREALRNVTNV